MKEVIDKKRYEHLIKSSLSKCSNEHILFSTMDFGQDLGDGVLREYSTINNKVLQNPSVEEIEIRIKYNLIK